MADAVDVLCKLALSLADVEERIACAGTAIEQASFRSGGKSFLLAQRKGELAIVRLKLDRGVEAGGSWGRPRWRKILRARAGSRMQAMTSRRAPHSQRRSSRSKVRAESRGRCQDAVIGHLVRARPGDQRAESLEQGPGSEDDVSAAVGMGVAQAQEDATLLVNPAAGFRRDSLS